MPKTSSLAIVAVLGGLCFAALTGRPAPAQPANQQQQANGRYQVFSVITTTNTPMLTVIDTQTGQCWMKLANQPNWTDYGNPVK